MATETPQSAREKGSAAWTAKDYDGAVHWFTQAIALDPNDSLKVQHILYSNRSAAYLMLGDAHSALADAESCCELKPSWPKGYSRRGSALFRLGRTQEAVTAYKKGLELDPSSEDMRKALLDAQQKLAEAGSGSGGGSFGGGVYPEKGSTSVTGFVGRYPELSMQALLRFGVVVMALVALVPFLSFSRRAYRLMMISYAVSNMTTILRLYGRPRFTKEYAINVLQSWETQGLLMALLMVTNRPYMLATLPILMTELTHVMYYVSCLLNAVNPTTLKAMDARLEKCTPAIIGSLGWSEKPLPQRYNQLNGAVAKITAQMEVTFGLVLVAEMLLPRRNMMLTVMYWQFMRMRVMLDRTGNMKGAFADVDRRVSSITDSPRCPSIVRTFYGKLKGVAASMVAVPDANSTATRPKCTIM